jgi:thiol-disulfide isomerase/thioredoxin
VVDRVSRQSSVWNRIFDALAIAVIAFAVWKIFVAPRSLMSPTHPAPHAVYELVRGGEFRIADQRGRLVFLDFYATWCEPCKLELPLVERWARAHSRSLVVPIDVGEGRSVAAEFARRYSLDNVALDPSASSRALFDLQGFPTIVVVDPHGYIRAKWEGLNPAIGLAPTNAEKRL